MWKKRGFTALLILCVLAIAFFWGGFDDNRPVKPAGGLTETQPANTTAPIDGAEDKPDEEHSKEEHDQAVIAAVTSDEGQADTGAVKPNNDEDSKGNQELGPQSQGKTGQETKADKTKEEAKATKPKQSVEAKINGNQAEQQPKETVTKSVDQPPSSLPMNDKEPKKDKYQTDPVPEGKPKPVEWQDVTINKKGKLTATLSVTAKTILENMDKFNQDKLEVLPADGIIYKAQSVTFYEGESVFDVLLREMKNNKIHMEFVMTPLYNSNYVEGINNLYEFDCGELSGWMYKVNGWFPNYGSSRYVLQDGDVIEWVYTCDLGRDVGGDSAVTGNSQR